VALSSTQTPEVGEEDAIMDLASITKFIKGQRIQCLRHNLRREENYPVRVAFEWKPVEKRPSGLPRKRWIYEVVEDLKTMGIEYWHEVL